MGCTLNNIFEHIYLINLDKYPRKLEDCSFEFNKFNIKNVNKLSGIVINNGLTIKDRELGCKLSHLKIVEIAKQNNWDNVLIFEDDIKILSNFNDYIPAVKRFIVNATNWDLLYFGGNHNKPFEATEFESITRCKRLLTTHAYAVNKSCYDEILNFKNNNIAIDEGLADIIQKKNNSYCLFPRKITQRKEYSDIRQCVCDYDRYLLDAHPENI